MMNMSKIFISYKHDTDGVLTLRKQLDLEGFNVWIDFTGLQIGTEDWLGEIDSNIIDCDVMILCLTPDACKSKWVKYEINKAIEFEKPVFPIILQELDDIEASLNMIGLPTRIQVGQFLTIDGWDDEFERLIIALQNRGIQATGTSRSLKQFEFLLTKYEWTKKEINHKEVWICDFDAMYQINKEEREGGFQEDWVERYTDRDAQSVLVNLTIQNVVIDQILFVYLDDFRVFVPRPTPDYTGDMGGKFDRSLLVYYWNVDSLEFKLANVVGSYGYQRNIYEFSRRAGIEIR